MSTPVRKTALVGERAVRVAPESRDGLAQQPDGVNRLPIAADRKVEYPEQRPVAGLLALMEAILRDAAFEDESAARPALEPRDGVGGRNVDRLPVLADLDGVRTVERGVRGLFAAAEGPCSRCSPGR